MCVLFKYFCALLFCTFFYTLIYYYYYYLCKTFFFANISSMHVFWFYLNETGTFSIYETLNKKKSNQKRLFFCCCGTHLTERSLFILIYIPIYKTKILMDKTNVALNSSLLHIRDYAYRSPIIFFCVLYVFII